MTRMKSWRWGCAICLTAVLMGFGSGCQPAGDSAGKKSTPTTTKPDTQPDDKDKPAAKQPKPDPG